MANNTLDVSSDSHDFHQPLMIGEASSFLNIHPKTLRRWENEGYIKPHRNSKNQRVYTRRDLEALKQLKRTRKQVSDTSRYYRISEVSERLGVSQKTIRRWNAAGAITCQRDSRNQRMFTQSDLAAALHYKETLEKKRNELVTLESSSYPSSLSSTTIVTSVLILLLSASTLFTFHYINTSVPIMSVARNSADTLALTNFGYMSESVPSLTTTNNDTLTYAKPINGASQSIQSKGTQLSPLDPSIYGLSADSAPSTSQMISEAAVSRQSLVSDDNNPAVLGINDTSLWETTTEDLRINTHIGDSTLALTDSDRISPEINALREHIQLFSLNPLADYSRGDILCKRTNDDTLSICDDNPADVIVGVLLEKKAGRGSELFGSVLTMGLYQFTTISSSHVGDLVTFNSYSGNIVSATEEGYILGRVVQVVHSNETTNITVSIDPQWYDPALTITSDGDLLSS